MPRVPRLAFAVPVCLFLTLAVLPAKAAPPTITFFVASDSHFGARGMSDLNRSVVEQMNALPGTPYPAEMGGQVETPRGVLFLGDTTDNGRRDEFAEFEAVYGHDGKGLLKFPVFVAIGNHDVSVESPVKDRVAQIYGNVDYAWDWDDLRVVCLDMYPDERTREWLVGELRKAGRQRPLVLFFHYSLAGPYSDFWEDADTDAFARAIEGYNVTAIFHGHEHHVGHYLWRGHPVFRPGAPRHSSHFFLAVRVGPRKMEVAAWNFDDRRWAQSWTVPVTRP
jgi:3',5'-cyclic AMP phosphodiesterase CpdA